VRPGVPSAPSGSLDFGDEAALYISTGLAAVAATASAVSAFQAWRITRAQLLPDLSVSIGVYPSSFTGYGLQAVIHNAGSGVARGLTFVVAANGHYAANVAGTGTVLRADELATIHAHIGVGDIESADDVEASAMVFARDPYGFTHVWTHQEKHYVSRAWLRRPKRIGNLETYFERKTGIDLRQFRHVRSGVSTER
jgi:hypothetical protein